MKEFLMSIVYMCLIAKVSAQSNIDSIAHTIENKLLSPPESGLGWTPPYSDVEIKDDPLGILSPIKISWEIKADDFFHLNNYDSAKYYYDLLILNGEKNCYNYFYRGLCTNNHIQAISDFNQAILLSPPQKNSAWIYHRWRLDENGVYDELGGISISYSKYYEIYVARGKAKSLLKDYRGAIQDFTKSIQYNPNDYILYYLRALEKYHLHDFIGAKSDLDKCLSYSKNYNEKYYEINDFTQAFFLRGLCNIYLGSKNIGCMDLSKAGEMGEEQAYDMIQKYCQ